MNKRIYIWIYELIILYSLIYTYNFEAAMKSILFFGLNFQLVTFNSLKQQGKSIE
jgi:hypothetical protein